MFNGGLMTLRHFKIFVNVATELNMTKTAKNLYISQSAVSQAIQELETHYDVRLFERFSRKIKLTFAGEKLLGYARHILRMHLDAAVEMQILSQNAPIRLGASVTVATSFLPKLIVDLQKHHPKMRVSVTEDNTAVIQNMILNDALDLGIVEGDLSSKEISTIPILDDELVFICSPKHPFSKKPPTRLDELSKENFILRELGSGTRKKFEEVMLKHQVDWQSNWTCNNADTIKMVVEENLGISVISDRAVKRECELGFLHMFKIDILDFKRTFKIIHHQHKYLTHSMEQFISVSKAK